MGTRNVSISTEYFMETITTGYSIGNDYVLNCIDGVLPDSKITKVEFDYYTQNLYFTISNDKYEEIDDKWLNIIMRKEMRDDGNKLIS